MPIQLVLAQLIGSELVPHPRAAGICRAPAGPWLAPWFFIPSGRRPISSGARLPRPADRSLRAIAGSENLSAGSLSVRGTRAADHAPAARAQSQLGCRALKNAETNSSEPCGSLSRDDHVGGITSVGSLPRQLIGCIAQWVYGKGRRGAGAGAARVWFRWAAAWFWSASRLAAAPRRCLDAAKEGVEAGGESLVAVAGPDVLAEGGQGGEAVGWQ